VKRTKVVGVSGSVRSSGKHALELEKFVKESLNREELESKIRSSRTAFSNTDICVAYALLGARDGDVDIEFVSLVKLFKHVDEKIFVDSERDLNKRTNEIENIDTLAIKEEELENLLREIESADGVILGSPAYFGDRSSVANKLLQLTNNKKLLKGKAFGVVSVGAKRNGGQETTNIYSLYEALMQDAVVVGNGPKTTQYGGTAWAGDPGKVLEDTFGLETCYGTGSRLADLSKVLVLGKSDAGSDPLNITVLVSMDTKEKKYESFIKDYCKKNITGHNFNIVNLTDHNIFRCAGCGVCPSLVMKERFKDKESPYICIIQNEKDSLKILRNILLKSDCIIVAGVNTKDDLIYRYQVFMERTRSIRRADFELTNVPVIGLLINESGSINNPLHNVKVLTSYIRHNMFVLKPVEILLKDDVVLSNNDFAEHAELIQIIKKGRPLAGPVNVSYAATGYGDKRLDDTFAARM